MGKRGRMNEERRGRRRKRERESQKPIKRLGVQQERTINDRQEGSEGERDFIDGVYRVAGAGARREG